MTYRTGDHPAARTVTELVQDAREGTARELGVSSSSIEPHWTWTLAGHRYSCPSRLVYRVELVELRPDGTLVTL